MKCIAESRSTLHSGRSVRRRIEATMETVLAWNRFSDMTVAIASPIEGLPDIILEEIALNLSYRDLSSLMLTCSRIYSVLKSNHFWRRYLISHSLVCPNPRRLDYRREFQQYTVKLGENKAIVKLQTYLDECGSYFCLAPTSPRGLLHLRGYGTVRVTAEVVTRPGIYMATWHFVGKNPRLPGRTVFNLRCIQSGREESQASVRQEREMLDILKSNCYTGESILPLFGPIHVSSTAKIQLHMENDSKDKKSGLYLKGVLLSVVRRSSMPAPSR